MKLISWLTGILLPFQFAMGQPILGIGDQLPQPVFNTIQNYPALKNPISNLKGKWLLLDFMATNCSSCIEAIPRFDSLQLQYGNRLQILLITYQQKEKIRAFLQKNPYIKNSRLPVLAEDSMLAALFPHQQISHEVWIDPSGIVRAITSAQYVNKKNMQLAMDGATLNLPIKKDVDRFYYDGKQPLLNTAAASFYSALLPFNGSGYKGYKKVIDTAAGTVRFSVINNSVVELYLLTYGLFNFPASHIVLDVNDPAAFLYDRESQYWGQWQPANTYGMEAVFSSGMSLTAMQEKMRADLDCWFGLHGRLQKVILPCYVLKENDTPRPLASALIKNEKPLSISNLVYILDNQCLQPPALDERTSKIKLNMDIDRKLLKDIPALNTALAAYGLALKLEPREVQVLKITGKCDPDFTLTKTIKE